MYQGSREMLIFLTAIFLIVNIACGIVAAIVLRHMTGGKLYLHIKESGSFDEYQWSSSSLAHMHVLIYIKQMTYS